MEMNESPVTDRSGFPVASNSMTRGANSVFPTISLFTVIR
jgi:hypothetical protein